jgi:hypothetical protein
MINEKKNVLYPGRIENGNLGDVLINGLMIIELLKYSNVYIKGRINKDILHFISTNSTNLNNLHILNFRTDNLILYKLNVLFYLIRNRKFEYVFDTPGHISKSGSALKTTLKSIFNLFSVYFYGFLGIKSIKYGITLGPFNNFNWRLYRYICKKSKLIVIRDSGNYDQLVKKNLVNIELMPDLAFLLVDLIPDEIKRTSVRQNLITLSFRGSLTGKEVNKKYFDESFEKLKDLILMLKTNIKLNQIDITYQVDCDKNTAELLKQKLDENFKDLKFNYISQQLNLETAIEQYSKSGCLVTNRLHVFLLAMITNTITFIITDIERHTKLISIIKDLGLQSLIYNSDSNTDITVFPDIQNFRKKSELYCVTLKNHINGLFINNN